MLPMVSRSTHPDDAPKKLQMVAGVPTPRLDTLNTDRTLSVRSVVGVSPCMIFNPLPYG